MPQSDNLNALKAIITSRRLTYIQDLHAKSRILSVRRN